MICPRCGSTYRCRTELCTRCRDEVINALPAEFDDPAALNQFLHDDDAKMIEECKNTTGSAGFHVTLNGLDVYYY